MKSSSFGAYLVVLLVFATLTYCLDARLQACHPSGKIRGIKPPPGQCNPENYSDCCKQGKIYTTYKCSPLVTGNTKAVLTPNSFQKGGDGGGPSNAKVVDECDSTMGCDDEHDYQPPCPNNIVDASKAVWEALGIPEGDWGDYDITWSMLSASYIVLMVSFACDGRIHTRIMCNMWQPYY
ncbi:unnamed protein product [Withania somnifera]